MLVYREKKHCFSCLLQVCKVPRGDVPGRIKALLTVESTLLVGAADMASQADDHLTTNTGESGLLPSYAINQWPLPLDGHFVVVTEHGFWNPTGAGMK